MAHIVQGFDKELERLYGELSKMGELAQKQLEQVRTAIAARDVVLLEDVIQSDKEIDQLEHQASYDVLRLLALRQPMARDLREVYSALKITTHLERIGDYAKNVAKRAKILCQSPELEVMSGLDALLKTARELVVEAMRAHRDGNAELARSERERDVELDTQYNRLFREVLTYMAEDPSKITALTHVLFMAKNIERIGDHATNIAECVYFVITGEKLLEKRAKLDTTNL